MKEVCAKPGQGKSTLPVIGCLKSATKASVNFYRGLNEELKSGLSHLGGSIRSGEAT